MNIQKYRILALSFLFLSFSIYLVNSSFVSGDREFFSNKNNTLQMSTSGTAEWYRTWGGSGYDICLDMVIDDVGNIYLAGITNSFGAGADDMCLIKFNSSGHILFNKTWGSTGQEDCFGIELDDSGNIYLAGSTDSYGAGSKDMCLVKFDNNGNFEWNKTWGGTGYEACYDIELDDSDNIYLAGSTSSFGAGANDMCLVKFSYTGNYIWNKTWGGSHDDRCEAIAINIYDEVCLAGHTRSFGDTVYGDIALVKYLWSGDYDWERIWAGNESDVCGSLATDAFGNFYLGGYTNSYGHGEEDALVIKYERSGLQKWNYTWGTTGREMCRDITIDSSDDIYITGVTVSDIGYAEMFVMKISYSKKPLWYRTWGLEYDEIAFTIALDSINNIYIGGVTESSSGESDICLVKNPKLVVSDGVNGYNMLVLNFIIITTLIIIISKRHSSKRSSNKMK